MEKLIITTNDLKESTRKINECSYIISVKKSEKKDRDITFAKKYKKRRWTIRVIIKL